MSLKDIDDFEDEPEIGVPKRRKHKLFFIPKKFKISFALLIIGLIVGIVLGHYYIEPIVNSIEAGTCSQCITTRDILTKENDCLLNYINDAQLVVDGCST